jgi:RNA polymerase sigma factor (sigma-70 family)
MNMLFPVTSYGARVVDLGSEDERLSAVRRGDARALQQTLVELLPFVRKKLHRLLGPRADLDDATQDALIELADALPRFEGRAKVTTFAHRIVVRVAYRHYGKKREAVPFFEDAHEAHGSSPEEEVSSREALAKLHRVLAKLPDKRRVAFVLCEIEGLEPNEAAEVAGTTALAMRTRLHYARSEVRRMLGVESEGGRV